MSLDNKDVERFQSDKSVILSDDEIKSIHFWISQMRQYRFRSIKEKIKKAKNTLKLKYNVIGSGVNRIVYDLNNGYIVKIAISNLGLKSNETEFDIYTHCPQEIKRYLCPMKEFGHGWIIMKKMKAKVPWQIIEITKLVDLQVKFVSYGILPLDLRMANVALSDENEIAVVDYGHFIRGLNSPHFRWFD
ncbi:hypothetical protein ELQ35_01500 [Peribacillus cavernae]|uniref:Protein kinase domain-containing protein n=1 Tax=Peribacillus cavernae TaxID=1674310 RepID=A0A433HWS3_9BACI|nr:hypothetical protein [Peribacillus cavernae]MDQ0218050.1 transcriptional regulator [Peribacillus cavernae]RUQ32789.1 hypothetical protein ELQ35_01500 [Peribacillus cavernae]